MKKLFALIAVCGACMLPAAASADSIPSQDQVNYSVYYTMTNICGHAWGAEACAGFDRWYIYNNGVHTYVVVWFWQTPGWGVKYHYCALTSWWRGYFHVDNVGSPSC